jgi:hypothetical protein
MPIDRGSYEPITGSPRRSTKKKKDTDDKDPNGSPLGAGGPPPGTQESDRGTSGAPGETDGVPTGSNGPPSGDPGADTDEATGHPRMSDGRKRRVKVTPDDWEKLEQVSEQLGVPRAMVYRIAFNHLCRSLDLKWHPGSE